MIDQKYNGDFESDCIVWFSCSLYIFVLVLITSDFTFLFSIVHQTVINSLSWGEDISDDLAKGKWEEMLLYISELNFPVHTMTHR